MLVLSMVGNHSAVPQAPVARGPHACPMRTVVTRIPRDAAVWQICRRKRSLNITSVRTQDKEDDVLACSTTCFDPRYPFTLEPLRLDASSALSGTGPAAASHPDATPMDDVCRSRIGRSDDAHMSMSFRVPAICSLKACSGRLKLTGQALWMMCVTDRLI